MEVRDLEAVIQEKIRGLRGQPLEGYPVSAKVATFKKLKYGPPGAEQSWAEKKNPRQDFFFPGRYFDTHVLLEIVPMQRGLFKIVTEAKEPL